MRPLLAHRRFWLSLAAAFTLAACGGGDGDDDASVWIGGALDRPTAVTAQSLKRDAPAVTQTVDYLSGTTPQTRTYTGADLWALLSGMGIQMNATPKNDVLNRYVLATGADGYASVFALGELHPDDGHKGAMLAYTETLNGSSGAIAAEDGPFRVTAPGDVKGGRYISQLVRLDVRASGSTAAGIGGGVSPGFTVSGAVTQSMTFDAAALQALPASTATVGSSSYAGVDLWTLLNTVVGLKPASSDHNPTLRMFAVATGSDGYKAMVSLGEINPSFGNRQALIATSVDGAPLERNGVARLVVPGDLKASRSVSNLLAIEVFNAAPAP